MAKENQCHKMKDYPSLPTLATEALKLFSFITPDKHSAHRKSLSYSSNGTKPAWKLFRTGKGALYDMAHVDTFMKFDREHCRRHGLENTIYQLPVEMCTVIANGKRRCLKVQGFLIWSELCDRILLPENSALKIIECATNTALQFRQLSEPCCWRYLNVTALNDKLLASAVLFLRQIFEFQLIVKFEDMVQICYVCWRRREAKTSVVLERSIETGKNPNCNLGRHAESVQLSPQLDERHREKPTQESGTAGRKDSQTSDFVTYKIPPSDLLFNEEEVQRIVFTMLMKERTEKPPIKHMSNVYTNSCVVGLEYYMIGSLVGKYGCTAGIIEHLTNSMITFLPRREQSRILIRAANQKGLDSAKCLIYLLAQGVIRLGHMQDTLIRMFFNMSTCPALCRLAARANMQKASGKEAREKNLSERSSKQVNQMLTKPNHDVSAAEAAPALEENTPLPQDSTGCKKGGLQDGSSVENTPSGANATEQSTPALKRKQAKKSCGCCSERQCYSGKDGRTGGKQAQ
uniref:Uncharacterized protein n=1 Tax=Trichuris muris TaxID=70415 RepID=A0A5S6QE56_TRIMR